MDKFRKLTPHDLAFGIGGKVTNEEWRELFSRPTTGERIDPMELLEKITKRLADKHLNNP